MVNLFLLFFSMLWVVLSYNLSENHWDWWCTNRHKDLGKSKGIYFVKQRKSLQYTRFLGELLIPMGICVNVNSTESVGVVRSSCPPDWRLYWSPSVGQSHSCLPSAGPRWTLFCSPGLSCKTLFSVTKTEATLVCKRTTVLESHLKNQLGSPLYVPSSLVTARLPRADKVRCTAAKSLPEPQRTCGIRNQMRYIKPSNSHVVQMCIWSHSVRFSTHKSAVLTLQRDLMPVQGEWSSSEAGVGG